MRFFEGETTSVRARATQGSSTIPTRAPNALALIAAAKAVEPEPRIKKSWRSDNELDGLRLGLKSEMAWPGARISLPRLARRSSQIWVLCVRYAARLVRAPIVRSRCSTPALESVVAALSDGASERSPRNVWTGLNYGGSIGEADLCPSDTRHRLERLGDMPDAVVAGHTPDTHVDEDDRLGGHAFAPWLYAVSYVTS